MTTSSNKHQQLTARITEAISECQASQQTIADYCEVSRQSVTNWKKTGQISDHNLARLAVVTGYSPQWLKSGKGQKSASWIKPCTKSCSCCDQPPITDPETQGLINLILYARANGKLTTTALSALTTLINTLALKK